MLYPGAGSLERLMILANLSKQFPTAMSKASPKIRYLKIMHVMSKFFKLKFGFHMEE